MSEDGSQARPNSLEGALWEELSFLVIGGSNALHN